MTERSLTLQKTRATQCLFGIGSELSKGTATVEFPLGDLCLSFDVHIVNADVPLLMSIDDIERLGVYLNNWTDELVHALSGQTAIVTRKYGHPFVYWDVTIK